MADRGITDAPGPAASLTDLRDRLRQFAAERDWDQFHSPKNLAIALSVEASELLEHFQWLTDAASASLDDRERASERAAEAARDQATMDAIGLRSRV